MGEHEGMHCVKIAVTDGTMFSSGVRTWKRPHQRFFAVVGIDPACFLIELANSLFAVEHSNEPAHNETSTKRKGSPPRKTTRGQGSAAALLDDSLEKLSACTSGGTAHHKTQTHTRSHKGCPSTTRHSWMVCRRVAPKDDNFASHGQGETSAEDGNAAQQQALLGKVA